jgi:CDP-diacylglycerol--glycerol-3-phosphate 3-phosphatidyltransferase
MNRASHALIDVAGDVVTAPLEHADEHEIHFLERARTALDPIVVALIHAGVSADAVTGVSLALGAFAGFLVAGGHFAAAAIAIALASIGDALDGAIARATRTASTGGAIFDAAVDRYEEFFFLVGLAFLFRLDELKLGLVFAAMIGSFMVSYGSAKAEACRVAVPSGSMRRAGRAICMVLGTALVPVASACVDRGYFPAWSRQAPIVIALALVGLLANVSAIVRLRAIGRAASSTAR